MEEVKFDTLKGKTFSKVVASEDALTFFTNEGAYQLAHIQECCENVYLEDVCGDLEDLCNSEIIFAEEVSSANISPEDSLLFRTWTFYKIGTRKGSVTIRFVGESNGYYSEKASLSKIS